MDVLYFQIDCHNHKRDIFLSNVHLPNGFEFDKTVDAINTFTGVERRTELIGTPNGISIYDDYGHHPTEMEATINAIKAITKGKLYVIFQPHRYTRTKLLFDRFIKPLSQADEVYILDIYSAGEKSIQNINSKNLVKKIKIKNKNTFYIKNPKILRSLLKEYFNDKNIIVFMGAGSITNLANELIS